MRLLLSGADYNMSEQKNPIKSIGGFISSSSVPNGKINSIFSDISIYSRMYGSVDCVAIFLFNDSNKKMTNLSIQQINSKNNICEFWWAVVSPTEGEYTFIEKIGSRKEEPYNVDWFQPNTVRENCKVKLKSPGVIGDVAEIMGIEFELTGNDLKSLNKDIIKALNKSDDYVSYKINDTSFYIENKSTTPTGNDIELVTPGDAELFDSTLSGSIDGNTLIIEELEPNCSIAFWIKRVIEKRDCDVSEDCVDLSCLDNSDTKENLEVIFSFD